MKKYERIRNLREDNDYTQENIARKLGITQRTYSRYENADSSMPLEILCQIADIYNVSTDYLLERTDLKELFLKSIKLYKINKCSEKIQRKLF